MERHNRHEERALCAVRLDRVKSPFWAPGLIALGAMLSTCEVSQQGIQDIEEQLQGTWLREYAIQGVKARRVLTLQLDGSFLERVRVVDENGGITDYTHEGTWLYDGTNLKRKYTMMNGRPPSRLNLPFATFQISFEHSDEFLGIDHIHGHRVRYRRVAPDTQP
jgi:hypothetical protein